MVKKMALSLTFLMLLMVSFEPISAINDNFWTTMAPVPQGEGSLGAVTLNGRIHVLGSNFTYEYTPASNTWVIKKAMPTPRSNFGIVAVDNKIFTIGGLTGDSTATGVNEVYDPTKDTWETKLSMPTSRWLLEANVVKNKIYLIGGIGGRNVTEVYDPTTDSWSTKAAPPTPIDDYASAVFDGKIYVIGGHEGGGVYTNKVQVYDPENDSWIYGQPAPKKVIFGSTGVTTGTFAPNRIYVLGVTEYIGMGISFGQHVPAVINQVFDPKNNSWVSGASPSVNRLSMATAVVNDKLYAIGGYTYESAGFHKIHEPSAVNEEYTSLDYGKPQTSLSPSANGQDITSPHNVPMELLPAVAVLSAVLIVVGIIVFYRRRKGSLWRLHNQPATQSSR